MAKILIIAMMVAVAVATQPFKPQFRARPPKPTGPPPCNLPPFINKLPTDVQLQLRTIWSSYVEGDEDCSSQIEDTKEVLDNLPASARLSLRPKGPPGMCGTPPFINALTPENQLKITSIWKNYKQGDDCMEQREATRYILEALPESEKMALARPPPLQ